MKARDHVILGFTLFFAVSAARVATIEYYRWSAQDKMETAAEKARLDAKIDAKIDREYEAMMREREKK